MKSKLKVLVAEGSLDARKILVEELDAFVEKHRNDSEVEFDIDKAESFEKAHQKIVNSETSKNYYDIVFADIDFTEDNKGGENDSGYKLIEKAFEICPLTKIATYTAQFGGTKGTHEKLKNKGIILWTFEKKHVGSDGMTEGLTEIVDEINQNLFLWDIWSNHQLITDSIKSQSIAADPFENLTIQNTIISNLESVLMLFMNIDRLQEKEIIYRMMIYLYHNSLELYCRSDKTDTQIIGKSDENKSITEKYISTKKSAPNDFEWSFSERVNAQRIFVSSIADEKIIFADTLNHYRNKSIHPKEKFHLELANVLFSSLTITLIVANNKSNIATEHISQFISKEKEPFGKQDFKDIVDFIKGG